MNEVKEVIKWMHELEDLARLGLPIQDQTIARTRVGLLEAITNFAEAYHD